LRNLISGAAGFIGSHLCDRLIEQGDTVVAVDNQITGHRTNIEHLLGNPAFHFIEHDICQPLEVREKVDRVFHLASLASPVDYLEHPVETLDVGSMGTRNMLEISRKHNARFLLTSTSECYGDPLEHPQAETYWGNVNPVGLRSCYDESKRFAEALTMAFHRKFGMPTTIARIFNTYGPRMRRNDGRASVNFLHQALAGKPLTVYGDGSQTRSLCYVDDLIRGLYLLAMSNEHLPVNLGNPGHELTMLELAEAVIRVTGSSSEIVFEALPIDDPQVRRPDITRAQQVLGWSPEIDLDEGLRRWLEAIGRDTVRA
jgi:dTDP-glucose 4,6-dehydratase